MADIVPLTWKDAAEQSRLIYEATQIFFETANLKVFETLSAREAFYERWFGNYLKTDPASFLLAVDENGAASGYLAGCLDSFSEAARIIISDIPFYTPAFCSALRDQPSHFHINVKPGYQGKGVGRQLMSGFFQLCRDQGSSGIHVVTGTTSRAVDFYRTCGFRPFTVPDAAPDLAVLVYAIPAP